jgi:hypothetical protein
MGPQGHRGGPGTIRDAFARRGEQGRLVLLAPGASASL